MLGPHLILDCYGCDKERLNDQKFILKFLDDLVKEIKMKKISEPQCVNYPGNPDSFDNGGISAVVLIAESHISVHTWPENGGYASIDIFSCKPFDIEKTIGFTLERLNPKKIEKKLMTRGREFPKDVKKAVKIVEKQRRTFSQ